MACEERCVCHVTTCMFVHTGGRGLCTVLWGVFFLPGTGSSFFFSSIAPHLYSNCSNKLAICYYIKFHRVLQEKGFQGQYTPSLPSSVFYFSFLSTPPPHLSPIIKKPAALNTDGQHCTIVFFSFFVSDLFFFLFVLCVLKKI